MNYNYNNRPPTRQGPPNPPPGGGYPAHQPPQYNQRPARPPANQAPGGLYGRGQQAAQGIAGLSQRAGYNSSAWWLYKVVQGCLISGILLLVALFFLFLGMLPGSTGLMVPGSIFLMALAVAVMLWYGAAPVTSRWIVTVPEQWYYVVEDRYGFTIDYLEPGRIMVPWRFNAKVYRYANFNSVVVNHTISNVLRTAPLPVTLKVRMTMAFNPMRAESEHFAWLRQRSTPEQFEQMLAQEIERIVVWYLGALDPDQPDVSLTDAPKLADVIVDQLSGQASRGLVPVADNPVDLEVDVPQEIIDAYRAARSRGARRNEEDQMRMDINTLARDLQVPYAEAFRLFYLLKIGAPVELGDTPLPTQSRLNIFNRFRRNNTPPPEQQQPSSATQPPAQQSTQQEEDAQRKTDEHQSVNPNGNQPDLDIDDYFNPLEGRGS